MANFITLFLFLSYVFTEAYAILEFLNLPLSLLDEFCPFQTHHFKPISLNLHRIHFMTIL